MNPMNDEFEVQRIAGRCYIKNVAYYLIEWKDYPRDQNTWECKDNLLGNDALIKEFLRTYRCENPGKAIIRNETLLLKGAQDAARPTGDDQDESVVGSAKKSTKSSKTNKTKHTSAKKRTTTTTNEVFDFNRSLSPLSISDSLDNESSVASTSNEALTPTEPLELTRPKKKTKKMLPVVIPENDSPIERRSSTRNITAAKEELVMVQSSLDNSKLESLRIQHGLVMSSDGVMTFDKVYPPVSVVNDQDKTPFPETFVYINNLIFNSAVPRPDPDFLSGCECIGRCRNVKGGNYCHEDSPYNNNGKLALTHTGAIYECNSNCTCDPAACPNRVVQRGRMVPLEIFKTQKKGWGVRTKTTIKKNTFVEEYLGEVITEEEGAIRGKVYDKIGLSYLFDMDLADGDDQKYVIDSYICGNSSHFFNHSCSPNLIVYGVFYDSMDPSFHRLAFFSNQDIPAGVELTFDYTGTNDADDTFSKKFPCHCGSNSCRNWIHI